MADDQEQLDRLAGREGRFELGDERLVGAAVLDHLAEEAEHQLLGLVDCSPWMRPAATSATCSGPAPTPMAIGSCWTRS